MLRREGWAQTPLWALHQVLSPFPAQRPKSALPGQPSWPPSSLQTWCLSSSLFEEGLIEHSYTQNAALCDGHLVFSVAREVQTPQQEDASGVLEWSPDPMKEGSLTAMAPVANTGGAILEYANPTWEEQPRLREESEALLRFGKQDFWAVVWARAGLALSLSKINRNEGCPAGTS